MIRTRKLTYGGLLLAIGILLPQVFHFTGIPNAGAIFLPMHIPVLFSGFFLGPVFGFLNGILTPLLSSLFFSMPSPARMPFMVLELASYGLLSGLFFRRLRLERFRVWGGVLSLLSAMAGGRAIYALALWIAAGLFHIPCGGIAAALTAVVTGLPGILIQLIFIPLLLYVLRKAGKF